MPKQKTYYFLCGKTGNIYPGGEFKDFQSANEKLMQGYDVAWLFEGKPNVAKSLPPKKKG